MRKPYYFKLNINGKDDKVYTRWLANNEWQPMFYLIKSFTSISLEQYGVVFDHYEENSDARTLTLYYVTYKETAEENTAKGDTKIEGSYS